MRKNYFAIVLIGLVVLLVIAACNKVTAPQLPNAFKITDFNYWQSSTPHGIEGQAVGTYTNNTPDVAIATGTINWGDGTTDNVSSGQILPNTSGRQWSFDADHLYAAKATYTVTITATCPFSNGSLSDTFIKEINVN
jgi:hypothetical protein